MSNKFYRDEQFDKLSEAWANSIIAKERGAASQKVVAKAFENMCDYLDNCVTSSCATVDGLDKKTICIKQFNAPCECGKSTLCNGEGHSAQPYAYTYVHMDGKRMWRMASSRVGKPESGWVETALFTQSNDPS